MKQTSRRGEPKGKSAFNFFSIIKILILLILIIAIAGVTLVGGCLIAFLKKSPDIDPKNYRSILAETSAVYDSHGDLIEKLVQNEFMEYVPLSQIPKGLQEAAIAIEDERFYEHNGVDYKRVGGALLHDLKTRSFDQGASTITMQLAKNLYSSHDKSIERKLQDTYYAFQLEQGLTKDEILEGYLNSAGFSKGTVGVQAAAKTFFDKDVSELTVAQSALIAGITNRPSKYTPFHLEPIDENDDLEKVELVLTPVKDNPEEATDEQKDIAQELLDLEKIDIYDQSQINSGYLKMEKAVFNPVSKERQELILEKMHRQGYLDDEKYQEALNEPIEIHLGTRGLKGISSYYVYAVKDEVIEILEAQGHSPEEANRIFYNGGLQINTSLDIEMQKKLEEVTSNKRYYPGHKIDENGIPQPQVGSVILDQHTGEVKALVGGRGIAGNNILNRAKNPRQPGSSIKPISVYLTAFNNGITAGDAYNDVPIKKGRKYSYAPKNSTGYQGWTTVRRLIIKSSNVGAYLVGKDISPYDEVDAVTKMYDTLHSIGFNHLVTPEQNKKYNDFNFSAMCLGGMTHGATPLEMAGGFTTLANEGKFMKPTFVNSITTTSGEEIYHAKREGKEITSPQNAYILTNILEDVVRRGTGTYANLPGFHEAGKTGTTNRKRDSWFVGYTPYYTCSVWIGNDDNTPLWDHSRMAARLWRAIMTSVHEDLEDKEFEKPDGIYRKYISGAGYTELFVDGTSAKNTKKLYRKPKPKPKNDDDKKDNDKKDNNNNKRSSKKSDNKNNNNN
ncbi:MAG: transglycosylase domain-containing protein [Tissierellia bacterium]|nr:transglycosylase domain-containing protein [Tissierellia bacterium]